MTHAYRKEYNKEKTQDAKAMEKPDFIVRALIDNMKTVGYGWFMYDLKRERKFIHVRFNDGKFLLLHPTDRVEAQRDLHDK